MEGSHCEAHQQPCTSNQLEQRQEREQTHLGRRPRAAGVSFADLPQPWLRLLVRQLYPWDRMALLSTCSSLAAAVVQHSSRVTLTTDQQSQHDSSRRRYLLKLVANSSNIVFQARTHAIPLDVADVWQGIQRLNLYGVSLDADTISTLRLHQLTQLHTIEITRHEGHSAVDTTPVQHLMQAGGLPALRTLKFAGMPATGELGLLQRVGPIMGHRVTKLVVGSCLAAAAVDKWPGLQRVHLRTGMACEETAAEHSAAIKQVFEHPQLKEMAADSHTFSAASSSHNASFSAGKLDVLELTDYAGPNVTSLLQVPLHAVKLLRVHTSISTSIDVSVEAAQHLRQCSLVEIVPREWTRQYKWHSFRSIADSTATREVSCDPLLLEWVLPSISNAEGVLILSSDPCRRIQGSMGRLHTASLRLLPAGIHTLAFDSCAVEKDCTWGQLVAQVPKHVQSLLVRRCAMTWKEFEGVLSHPPPAGLQRLYLGYSRNFMYWVSEQTEAAIRAAASAKWPGVQLQLHFQPHWGEEEEDDYEEEEEEEEEAEVWEDVDESGEYEDLDREPSDSMGQGYGDEDYEFDL